MAEEMFGQSMPPHDHEDPEMIQEVMRLDDEDKEIDVLSPEKNFQGNWVDLFEQRIKHEETKKRFLESKTKNETAERKTSYYYDMIKSSGRVVLEKPEDIPLDHYVFAQTQYDKNAQKVFSSKRVGKSFNYNKFPLNKGVSAGYGDEGVVFDDATTGELGIKLDEHQMDIILAHEKAHGIFGRLTHAEKKVILEPFDRTKIKGYGFSDHADEIVARMSQLKNYFGFKGDEEFRVEHLRYARKHYVEDTKLDNNMTEFFDAISDEQKFVDVMNTMPC